MNTNISETPTSTGNFSSRINAAPDDDQSLVETGSALNPTIGVGLSGDTDIGLFKPNVRPVSGLLKSIVVSYNQKCSFRPPRSVDVLSVSGTVGPRPSSYNSKPHKNAQK